MAVAEELQWKSMTFDDFLVFQSEWISDSIAEVEIDFLVKITQTLRSRYTPDFDRLAKKILFENLQLLPNANFFDDVDPDPDVDDIYSYSKLVKNKYRVLLVSVPTGKPIKSFRNEQNQRIPLQLSLEENEKQRDIEFDKFCKILFPDFTRSEPGCFRFVSVYKEADFYFNTENFFLGYDSIANSAPFSMIVFNGEGIPEGFVTEEDTLPIPLEKIVDHAVACFKKCKETNSTGMPAKLIIVFAQCHGYLYKKREIENVTVEVLTSLDRKKTESKIHIAEDPLKNVLGVTFFGHVDLEDFAIKFKQACRFNEPGPNSCQ